MIQHHLTPALLMAYSAGNLPEAFDLVVATHLSMCDACRAEAETYDVVGGSIVEAGEEASLSADCLSNVMALIRAEPVGQTAPAIKADPDLPAPLASYVGGRLSDVKWRPIGMGVRQAILPTSGEATARLLHIPAGTALPDHGHKGMEITLVLKGAFEDADGRFARGDVELATEDLDHTPVADISEDCICLAVTDAPLRFKSLLPRLAQRFIRI